MIYELKLDGQENQRLVRTAIDMFRDGARFVSGSFTNEACIPCNDGSQYRFEIVVCVKFPCPELQVHKVDTDKLIALLVAAGSAVFADGVPTNYHSLETTIRDSEGKAGNVRVAVRKLDDPEAADQWIANYAAEIADEINAAEPNKVIAFLSTFGVTRENLRMQSVEIDPNPDRMKHIILELLTDSPRVTEDGRPLIFIGVACIKKATDGKCDDVVLQIPDIVVLPNKEIYPVPSLARSQMEASMAAKIFNEDTTVFNEDTKVLKEDMIYEILAKEERKND